LFVFSIPGLEREKIEKIFVLFVKYIIYNIWGKGGMEKNFSSFF